jgi:hypothetical protein
VVLRSVPDDDFAGVEVGLACGFGAVTGALLLVVARGPSAKAAASRRPPKTRSVQDNNKPADATWRRRLMTRRRARVMGLRVGIS